MPKIINALDYPPGLEPAVRYIHDKWGSEENYDFYYDAISHSSPSPTGLPRFYLLIEQERVIGCYALLTNDLISRQDLYPWFACLFIEAEFRGRNYSALLMDHALKEAKRCSYPLLYLATTHEDFYERFGWNRIEDGFEPWGKRFRIYSRKTL